MDSFNIKNIQVKFFKMKDVFAFQDFWEEIRDLSIELKQMELEQQTINSLKFLRKIKKIENSNFSTFFKSFWKEKDSTLFVAFLNEKIIGYALTSSCEFEHSDFLREFIVKKKLRSKGIGNLIISQIKTSLKKQNKNHLFLGVLASNTNALDFYRSLGFEYHSLELVLEI